MSGDNRRWFWTPERLTKLRKLLDEAAKHDDEGHYFGPISLSSHVVMNGHRVGLDVHHSLANDGLAILTFLGLLEPGKQGRKLPGYKRRYYPNKIGPITEADINRFRQAQGVKSPMPPAR